MALGLFLQGVETEHTILEIRATCIANLAAGVVTTSWSSEGSSETLQQTMSTRVLLEECNAFLQAYDPVTYGKRIKRTSPSFYSSF